MWLYPQASTEAGKPAPRAAINLPIRLTRVTAAQATAVLTAVTADIVMQALMSIHPQGIIEAAKTALLVQISLQIPPIQVTAGQATLADIQVTADIVSTGRLMWAYPQASSGMVKTAQAALMAPLTQATQVTAAQATLADGPATQDIAIMAVLA